MKRIGIVGLCLAAVFAFSGMVASSASADGLLLALAAGGGSIVGVTFLSLGVNALLTTHGSGGNAGKLIECGHVSNFGHFLSPTLGDVLIRFFNCKIPIIGEPKCTGTGAGTGEIHLPLASTVFHLGLAHLTLAIGKIPAIVLLLTKDALFICGAGELAHVLVLGSVIGALRLDLGEKHGPLPLNTPESQVLLAFEQTAHGLQHLRLFLFEHELRTYDLDALVTELGTLKPLELAAEQVNILLSHFLLPNGKEDGIELVEDK